MQRLASLALALGLVAACGSPVTPAGDAGPDVPPTSLDGGDVPSPPEAGEDVAAAIDGTTPADGGGVCCPYTTACDCLGGGGWAPSASMCPSLATCAADGRWGLSTDDHGCAMVTTGSGPNCCGCPSVDAGAAE